MKLLVSPLLWSILLLLGMLFLNQARKQKYINIILVVTVFLLIIFSIPVVSRGLRGSLYPAVERYDALVHYIFILSGGYHVGSVASEDVLTSETERRVLHAIDIWQRHPDAFMVMSGRSHSSDPDRETELMAEVARSKGVPSDKLILEANSINTRAHPIEVLKLPNIHRDSTVVLVTSDWHIRRASYEFCRYFAKVFMDPVMTASPPLTVQHFLPNVYALAYNTMLIGEWFGLAWYSLTAVMDTSIPSIDSQCIG